MNIYFWKDSNFRTREFEEVVDGLTTSGSLKRLLSKSEDQTQLLENLSRLFNRFDLLLAIIETSNGKEIVKSSSDGLQNISGLAWARKTDIRNHYQTSRLTKVVQTDFLDQCNGILGQETIYDLSEIADFLDSRLANSLLSDEVYDLDFLST